MANNLSRLSRAIVNKITDTLASWAHFRGQTLRGFSKTTEAPLLEIKSPLRRRFSHLTLRLCSQFKHLGLESLHLFLKLLHLHFGTRSSSYGETIWASLPQGVKGRSSEKGQKGCFQRGGGGSAVGGTPRGSALARPAEPIHNRPLRRARRPPRSRQAPVQRGWGDWVTAPARWEV